MRSGRHPKDLDARPSHSGDRHLRKAFPDVKSASTSRVIMSPKGRRVEPTSTPSGPKEFLKRLFDIDTFCLKLQSWLEGKQAVEDDSNPWAEKPFQLDELRQFDFALEGVQFHQLLRMPSSQSSSSSISIEAEMCLAVEDFLHASAQALWDTFWGIEDSFLFFVTGSHGFNSKHAHGEKHSSRKSKGPQCAALVGKVDEGAYALWEHIVVFVLIKADIRSSSNPSLPRPAMVGQALFYGLHMLLSRRMTHTKSAIHKDLDVAYVLLADCQDGCVVTVKGDVSQIDMHASNVYDSAAEWLQEHAVVKTSSVEQVWNKFGNANWGDLGALQLLLATFHSMEQCRGTSKKSIAEMATEHNARLQQRKTERRIVEMHEHDNEAMTYPRSRSHGEILEIEEEGASEIVKELERLKLEAGTVLWLEDSHWQRGFKILDDVADGRHSVYTATALDDGGKLLNVYVGAHPSQLEPSWEDMSTWYQVQRQTRVLNVIKQRGISSKYLPQLVACGRILHPGSCTKQSPNGRCDHPWCGTPILVTCPVGQPLDMVVKSEGLLSPEEALKCCHDCLSALRSAGSSGIQHGDITPEHILRVVGSDGDSYHVLVEWGHAVLEDRDSPGISLRFSSTYALQEGKLCPASDAESLVYVLYFLCGGNTPQFDSIESALQWRERFWARRAFQQQLGEVSAVLKAFADYVDSLCGTPYPVDYDIWLRRLSRALYGEDAGKRMEQLSDSNMAESSGVLG